MRWKIANNVISSLDVEGKNVIFPWGVETADSHSFFSLEEGVGWRYQEMRRFQKVSTTEVETKRRVKMREGYWQLHLKERLVGGNTVIRNSHLRCLEESFFMDFVLRFRFKKTAFTQATIADQIFFHQNTNIYRQYPVDCATLEGPKLVATIAIKQFQAPPGFAPYLYVRDAPDEWVVHARMLPQTGQKTVIKLCNSWARTRPLPQWLSDLILAIPQVKKALWYRCENKPYTSRILQKVNPQACLIAKVPKRAELSWTVVAKILKKISL